MNKENIKKWLKRKENLLLLGVLSFAFLVRIYYFVLTNGQPLWWDEAAYGSLAKNFAYGLWSGTDVIIGETGIRPLFFPLIWSFLVRLGASEGFIRFALEFIPSFVAVLFVYLTINEIYGKKTGIISTFMFSVLWIHLFYTGRLLTNVPAMGFLFPSIYLFIRSVRRKNVNENSKYPENEKQFVPKYFAGALFLAGLSTITRYPNGLIFGVYLSFLIVTLRFDLLKNKKFWTYGTLGMAPLILFFGINLIKYGNIFPALLGNDYVKSVNENFGFHVLNFIPTYLTNSFFVLFLIGILLAGFELFIGFDRIRKNNELQGHLLLSLLFIFVFSFFIFYIRGAEDRWLFPASLSLMGFAGLGLSKIHDYIKKYGKEVAAILIIVLLAWGAYSQLNFADSIIKDRKQSYLQIREGLEWVKENTPENSVILGGGHQVYVIYYAERQYLNFPENVEDIPYEESDYLILHGFSNHPDYVNSYVQENQDKWRPINIWYFDNEQQQPAFVIFEKVI